MSVTARAIERVVRENSMGEVERWACTRAKVYYLKTRRGRGIRNADGRGGSGFRKHGYIGRVTETRSYLGDRGKSENNNYSPVRALVN